VASFWKRGSIRSGSNMGSSRSRAGVSGTFSPSAALYGIESTFCKAVTARPRSHICAVTRARMSIEICLRGFGAPTRRKAGKRLHGENCAELFGS
jgi:hypothetical protein